MDDLKDTLTELSYALGEQRRLVSEISALRAAHSVLRAITVGLVIVVFIVAYGVLVARNAAEEAQQATNGLERVVESLERDRLEACRVRNQNAEALREELLQLYQALGKDFNPNQADRDCDGDGELTSADY